MNTKMIIGFLVWFILTAIFVWINQKMVKKQIANSPNPEYAKRERMHIGGLRVDISLCILGAGLITAFIFYLVEKICVS